MPRALLILLLLLAQGVLWTRAAAPAAEAHWAFQPVRRVEPPPPADPAASTHPIDRFLRSHATARGIEPAPPADRLTLIRRVTYDLTGLPPTPEEVDAFLQDTAPDAFSRVVERLLASPRYGEHWGRHWLDVVRYADTAGENTDHPLPHAWRYRNWVLQSISADLPYDEFIREQLAGDLLAASGPPEKFAERTVATGYLAIARRFGHDIDKDMHLTLEDTIDTLGKSILGLTLGCARCHDHKFDPVSIRDYYGLYGIFESTRFAFPGCEPNQRPRDLVPLMTREEIATRRRPYEEQLASIERTIGELKDAQTNVQARVASAAAQGVRRLAAGEFDDGKGQWLSASNAPIELSVKAGQMIRLAIFPRGNHGADTTLVEFELAEVGGHGGRWNVTQDVQSDLYAANPHADRQGHAAVWCFLDLRKGVQFLPEGLRDHDGRKGLHGWRNGDTPSVVVNAGDKPIEAWTSLPAHTFFMHPGPDGPVGLGWMSPIDGTVRITGRLADAHPGGPDGVSWTLELGDANLSSAMEELAALTKRLAEPLQQLADLRRREPRPEMGYAVAEGRAKNARLQKRGDPEQPGEEVPRKFLDRLGGQRLAATNASGRLELAHWLTSPTNPLTARVMANRIWLGHFGRGLVPTPNDFGLRGQPPTHPELLDWLADEFVRSGWSLKAMHRRILSSAAYQQAGGAGADGSTAAYMRFARRRLGAEELRDTLLVASGELDPSPGGPHPFPPEDKWSFTQHGPFAAEYDTTRRSVYVMQKRNRRTPFFALFDGPDPNASTALRDVTTVPTQALYFMNDPFVHARATRFAERVIASAPQDEARLTFASRLLFGRTPDPAEQADAADFLRGYRATCTTESPAERDRVAWSAYARVLLGSNELLHVD